MGSITQSPDRVAQVLSGSVVIQGAGDSALQPADSHPNQAVTGVSAAEFVYESRQQQSCVSEGVASAGHPPQLAVDRMDETLPAPGGGENPAPSAAAGYEGETSGGNNDDAAAEESNGYDSDQGGEVIPDATPATAPHAASGLLAAPAPAPAGFSNPIAGSPMDYQAAGPSHHSGKRKSCGAGGSADALDAKRPEGAAGLSRVPSDMAMVTGMSDGEGGDPVEAPARYLPDAPCDSAMAGIVAGVAAATTAGGDTAGGAPYTGGAGNGGADGAAGPARPTDADIIEWENQIREDEVKNIPLVGDLEPIETLQAEYRHGSGVFLAKIAALRASYQSIRRTRGDGNCFFRSFVFAYLESIMVTEDLAERDAAVGRLVDMQSRLVATGYEELVLETPMEFLLGMLRSIGSISNSTVGAEALTQESLENNMRAEDVSNYIVFLLRLVTSAEVKRRAEFFAPFVLGVSDMDIDSFCSKCIDPMGEESDHVQMVALTDALRVPVRVIYLDRSTAPGGSGGGGNFGGSGGGDGFGIGSCGGDAGCSYESGVGGAASFAGTLNSAAAAVDSESIRADVHDFVPEGITLPPGTSPRVCLLYRPGHYDILYERNLS